MSKQLHHMRLMARRSAAPLEEMLWYDDSEIKPLTDDQKGTLKQIEYVADNTFLTAISGLSALGETLAGIGSEGVMAEKNDINTDLMISQRLADLGWLINGLAEMAQETHDACERIGEIKEQQVRFG